MTRIIETLTKEELLDSNNVVRGCVKISNALINIDNLLEGDWKLPRKLQQDLHSFCEFVETHTKAVIDGMINTSVEMTFDVYGWFTDIEKYFKLDDARDKEFAMLFGKLISAVHDFSKVNVPYMRAFAEPLISRSNLLVDRYNRLPFVDLHKESFAVVVKEIDNLGSKIITSEKGREL